jgi:preprotein translocase subunit SecG
MTDLLIWILTFILVTASVLLILLILIQLPKKEAGIGVAFGAAATDALFGAGSGTVLTKVTRYAATVFLSLAFVLAVLQNHRAKVSGRSLDRELDKRATPTAVTPPPVPPTVPSNLPLQAVQPTLSTNPPSLMLQPPAGTNLPTLEPVGPPPATSTNSGPTKPPGN